MDIKNKMVFVLFQVCQETTEEHLGEHKFEIFPKVLRY